MRCPSCNKMASYDTGTEPEVELDDPQFDKETSTVTVNGTSRIVLTSECCGEELKAADFEFEVSFVLPNDRACKCEEFTAESSAGVSERRQSVDAKGKPINPRYAKTFYGVEGSVELACDCGKLTLSQPFGEECQASNMEELV